MGLRILTVAWMQKESLLSIVSENWTHIFKSRKFEKPCMDYWAKKNGKIAIKHVQNTFGHFWDRFWAFLEFWIFFHFFENFRWINRTMSKKTFPKKMPQDTLGHWGTILDIFRTLNVFWFFSWIISKSLPQKKSGKLNSNFLSTENWTHIFIFGNLNSIF